MKRRLHRILTGDFTPWPYTRHPERAMTRNAQRHLTWVASAWAVLGLTALSVVVSIVGLLATLGADAWSHLLTVTVLMWMMAPIPLLAVRLFTPDEDLTAHEVWS